MNRLMIMGNITQKGIASCLLGCIIFFSGPVYISYAATLDSGVKRKPLRVVIRPKERDDKQHELLTEPEMHRMFYGNGLDIKWDYILNNRFFSGHEDVENLKKYGYSVNSDIGHILQMKIRATDDPDNLLTLKEYGDKQLYSDATSETINPMLEIKQGCKTSITGGCGFQSHGQFWLKANLKNIESFRERSDNFLVNLLKAID